MKQSRKQLKSGVEKRVEQNARENVKKKEKMKRIDQNRLESKPAKKIDEQKTVLYRVKRRGMKKMPWERVVQSTREEKI